MIVERGIVMALIRHASRIRPAVERGSWGDGGASRREVVSAGRRRRSAMRIVGVAL